jgi:hypothetical protein
MFCCFLVKSSQTVYHELLACNFSLLFFCSVVFGCHWIGCSHVLFHELSVCGPSFWLLSSFSGVGSVLVSVGDSVFCDSVDVSFHHRLKCLPRK